MVHIVALLIPLINLVKKSPRPSKYSPQHDAGFQGGAGCPFSQHFMQRRKFEP